MERWALDGRQGGDLVLQRAELSTGRGEVLRELEEDRILR